MSPAKEAKMEEM